jgi:biopolymer transport protein ExbD
MSWQIRHQGSPSALKDLTLQQIAEGLADGRWEPTDEVMGPGEPNWVPIENHPQLAEIAADLEPPPERVYDDETNLDLTALIDVCLVLLIVLILTTSYAVLQKRLQAPGVSAEHVGPPVITKEKVDQQMVLVSIKMENGQPVFRVEKDVVDAEDLQGALSRFLKATGKTQLLLQSDDEVPQSAVVAVLDAAAGARMEKVSFVVPDKR